MKIENKSYYFDPNYTGGKTNTTYTYKPYVVNWDWEDSIGNTFIGGVRYPQPITESAFEEAADKITTRVTKDGKSIEMTFFEALMLKKYGINVEESTFKEISKYLVEIKL